MTAITIFSISYVFLYAFIFRKKFSVVQILLFLYLVHFAFSNAKCVLTNAELKTDIFGDDGPLRNCPECQKIAKDLKKKIFDAPEDIRLCLRLELADAIVDELQPCIARELDDPNFRVPSLPDFDKGSSSFQDTILKAVSYRVMAYSRLYVCGGVSASRANATQAALQDKTGLFDNHCKLSMSCKETIDSSCHVDFDKVEKATCKCMFIKKDEWHAKFEMIRDSIENFRSQDFCSKSIKDAVGGWRYKLQSALRKCVPARDNLLATLSIDKAIDTACGDFMKFDSNKRAQVVNGIRMVRNLLDALNDRTTRFCEIQC